MVLELHLLHPRSKEAPDEELEPLELRLYHDQLEIRLRVHIPRLVLHELDLQEAVVSNTSQLRLPALESTFT